MNYDYFIASRWRNKALVEELVQKIRAKGKRVYSFLEGDGTEITLKNSESNLPPEDFMDKFEHIPDWQNDKGVKEIFAMDMKALRDSTNFILLLPAGKSSHIESGTAYGLEKNCIVIGEQKEAESLYLIFDEFYKTIDDFIKSL